MSSEDDESFLATATTTVLLRYGTNRGIAPNLLLLLFLEVVGSGKDAIVHGSFRFDGEENQTGSKLTSMEGMEMLMQRPSKLFRKVGAVIICVILF